MINQRDHNVVWVNDVEIEAVAFVDAGLPEVFGAGVEFGVE